MCINPIVWVIVGAIAGWLASIVMKTNKQQGLLMDIVVGIIGSVIGGWVLSLVGIGDLSIGLGIGNIITAFVGAVILLGVLRIIRR